MKKLGKETNGELQQEQQHKKEAETWPKYKYR
jgi:hypothetical protein